jgi:LacI family transcriptional regulator
MRALGRCGLRVPNDVALVAFDDFDWADVFAPHLTAIGQPIDQIAQGAVSMLFERIAGSARSARTRRPAGLLRQRESCGCAPGAPATGVAGGPTGATTAGAETGAAASVG